MWCVSHNVVSTLSNKYPDPGRNDQASLNRSSNMRSSLYGGDVHVLCRCKWQYIEVSTNTSSHCCPQSQCENCISINNTVLACTVMSSIATFFFARVESVWKGRMRFASRSYAMTCIMISNENRRKRKVMLLNCVQCESIILHLETSNATLSSPRRPRCRTSSPRSLLLPEYPQGLGISRCCSLSDVKTP